MSALESLMSRQGIISIVLVAVVCVALVVISKKKKGQSLSTKDVVAIGIGAALYGVLSMITIPVGPNTSFRIAIAVLVIFGALFGPTVGFLVGFIGHALNDALAYGGVWWSWVFLSAVIGLFAGLITLDKNCDIKIGKFNKGHVIKMFIFALIGMVVGGIAAYCGDVFLYGEPADKVWVQIAIASVSNFVVIVLVGIPAVYALAKRNRSTDLDIEI
ncbi:ECF-type riboflavin transporter substrate-binding protein [Oceanirhabdus sp. W0125-5]|uniref:ECF-type riboflavin transporter substrate-binding protein n=1 Tax=Oceanirhabdus sp. W0125-5 TaxID=2999116 RepID=UPI0022F2D121|nr:ECF-type riboflavin transporter substrate-binding protein [Oceanirhabdus sp. W0125-5]WBW97742.1 ECF-type riboflavin transporter substrate-binding protein [Oceanirhabdus sp. W0125-5]